MRREVGAGDTSVLELLNQVTVEYRGSRFDPPACELIYATASAPGGLNLQNWMKDSLILKK